MSSAVVVYLGSQTEGPGLFWLVDNVPLPFKWFRATGALPGGGAGREKLFDYCPEVWQVRIWPSWRNPKWPPLPATPRPLHSRLRSDRLGDGCFGKRIFLPLRTIGRMADRQGWRFPALFGFSRQNGTLGTVTHTGHGSAKGPVAVLRGPPKATWDEGAAPGQRGKGAAGARPSLGVPQPSLWKVP